MTNLKKTRRALLGSVLALILCFAMLLGSTWAWFTDSATTNVAVIKTGSLAIDLLQYVDGTNDVDLTETNLTFNVDPQTEILWEPGATWYTNEFYILNKGNLAVRYHLSVAQSDTAPKLDDGSSLFKVTLQKKNGATWEAVQGNFLSTLITNQGESSDYFRIAITMSTEAGNDFNAAQQNAQISFENIISVQVLATQAPVELDGNGTSDYDNIQIVDTDGSTSFTFESVEETTTQNTP